MNSSKKESCRCLWCSVSKIVSRMRPTAPAMAAIIAQMERIFWAQDVLCASLPVCRSQRSVTKPRVKTTTVVVPIAMKRGLRLVAPTSDI